MNEFNANNIVLSKSKRHIYLVDGTVIYSQEANNLSNILTMTNPRIGEQVTITTNEKQYIGQPLEENLREQALQEAQLVQATTNPDFKEQTVIAEGKIPFWQKAKHSIQEVIKEQTSVKAVTRIYEVTNILHPLGGTTVQFELKFISEKIGE